MKKCKIPRTGYFLIGGDWVCLIINFMQFMSIENILAIIGLVVTIVFGFLGLRYTLLDRRKTEVIFLKNASISLFKTIVKNLDDIEIKFRGSKINENLILFKGTLFNSGNVDIEKSIVHMPLEIELPSNYNWVSHNIIDMSEGLGLTAQISGNKLIFEWDLLKEGEFFTFDSLIEYQSHKEDQSNLDVERKLVKNLIINHRITDLKKINKENSIPRPMPFGGLFFMSFVFLAFILGLFYISFGQFVFPNYHVLNEVKLDNTTHNVSLHADNSTSVILKNEKGDNVAVLDKNELEQKLGTKIQISKNRINYFSLIFWGILSIIYFIAWISMIVGEVRQRRLYGRLKIVADKYNEIDFENRRRVGFKLFEFRFR